MQSLTVKDLMVPKEEYATISSEATLRDAALALHEAQTTTQRFDPTRYRDRALLVIDQNNQVIGKLSMLNVLRGLEPRYDRAKGSKASSKAASRVGTSRILIESMAQDIGLWRKPLSNLVGKACTVKVQHLISPFAEGETIDENASLDTALHQLITGQFQSLLVTRKKIVVGILRLTDVYEEISRMLRSCSSEQDDD